MRWKLIRYRSVTPTPFVTLIVCLFEYEYIFELETQHIWLSRLPNEPKACTHHRSSKRWPGIDELFLFSLSDGDHETSLPNKAKVTSMIISYLWWPFAVESMRRTLLNEYHLQCMRLIKPPKWYLGRIREIQDYCLLWGLMIRRRTERSQKPKNVSCPAIVSRTQHHLHHLELRITPLLTQLSSHGTLSRNLTTVAETARDTSSKHSRMVTGERYRVCWHAPICTRDISLKKSSR